VPARNVLYAARLLWPAAIQQTIRMLVAARGGSRRRSRCWRTIPGGRTPPTSAYSHFWELGHVRFYHAQVERRGKENWTQFYGSVVREEMAFERAVAPVAALLPGVDPICWGGVAGASAISVQIELLALRVLRRSRRFRIVTSKARSWTRTPDASNSAGARIPTKEYRAFAFRWPE
jgi:hypothetical protein